MVSCRQPHFSCLIWSEVPSVLLILLGELLGRAGLREMMEAPGQTQRDRNGMSALLPRSLSIQDLRYQNGNIYNMKVSHFFQESFLMKDQAKPTIV